MKYIIGFVSALIVSVGFVAYAQTVYEWPRPVTSLISTVYPDQGSPVDIFRVVDAKYGSVCYLSSYKSPNGSYGNMSCVYVPTIATSTKL